MNDGDRKQLVALGVSAEAIEKAEQVLAAWGVERLFVACSDCGKACFDPNVPRRKYKRMKLPAELFFDEASLGYKDRRGDVICWTCDEERFQ